MNTLITSEEKMTDGQVSKVKELVEAALRKSGLDRDAVQRVIEKGDDFQKEITSILQELAELFYADEEVKSTYGYPKEWQLKIVSEQLTALQKIEEFETLNASQVIELARGFSELPKGAEGLAVIPKPSKVASSYNEAVVLMTELMAKHRKDWYNCWEGYLDPKYLRLTEKTQQTLTKLEEETPGDFLVIPVQTGLRYRGRSVRRTRIIMSANEWGLGLYETGIILLVHPERLQKNGHLAIDCPGCEYSSEADGIFSGHLYFNWFNGKFRLDKRWLGYAPWLGGSSSAFLE